MNLRLFRLKHWYKYDDNGKLRQQIERRFLDDMWWRYRAAQEMLDKLG